MKNCGKCHTCGTKLQSALDGEEWCDNCDMYRRYKSHGWPRKKPVLVGAYVEELSPTEYVAECPQKKTLRQLEREDPEAALRVAYKLADEQWLDGPGPEWRRRELEKALEEVGR